MTDEAAVVEMPGGGVDPGVFGLPGSLTRTSLSLSEGLSYNDWAKAGALLGQIGKAAHWWIGDWLNYGEAAYGEKYVQAVEATGYDEQSLMNMAWVAGKIPASLRMERLSWSHHREVAKLPEGEQGSWLEDAAEGEWNVSELRREVKRAAPDGQENTHLSDREAKALTRQVEAIVNTVDSAPRYVSGLDLDRAFYALSESQRRAHVERLTEVRSALSRVINALS